MKKMGIFLTVAVLVVGLTTTGAGRVMPAFAHEADCDTLHASVVYDAANDECDLNGAITKSGTVALGHTLHIGPAGSITVPVASGGNSLTLNITGGLIMDVGADIIGDVTGTGTASGVGATITINASEDILLAGDGSANSAKITSNQNAGSCTAGGRGGNINLTSAGGNITTQEGTVISVNARCPAGDIVITTSGAGLITIDGLVESRSLLTGTGAVQRPGGGTITIIAGCGLLVSDTGVVSSQGADPGADLVHLEGCVVTILGIVRSFGSGHAIPNSPTNHCYYQVAGFPSPPQFPVNPADDPQDPRLDKHPNSTACVEIWSGTTITIDRTGDSNGEVYADLGLNGTSNEGMNWVDLYARGDINIIGDGGAFAVHANGLGGTGGDGEEGGLVNVMSTDGKITASGNAVQASTLTPNSASGDGGVINMNAKLDIDLTDGEIEARGHTGGTSPNGGTVNVRSWQGDILANAASLIDVVGDASNGDVTLQACGVIQFPPGQIIGADGVGGTTTITPGFSCVGAPVPPDYVVLPAASCVTVCVPGDDCEKSAVRSVLNPTLGRFPGNLGPDEVVRLDLGETVQDAVTNAVPTNADPYLIILVVKDGTGLLGGHTTENVVISKAYELRFALIACSVTINAADPSLPAGYITAAASSPAGSAENIFVMDLHGAQSNVEGWKVVGNGRYLRNVATNNNGTGVSFTGNSNVMHNGNAVDNTGVGLVFAGNGNKALDTDLFDNGGAAATVNGNANLLSKLDVGDRGKGNGSGAWVTGNSNQVLELDVFSNAGDGIVVSGNSNTIKKNNVGERGKANAGDGIRVIGFGNQILENEALANTGDGFDVNGGTAAAPNVLKKNQAGDRDQGNGANGFRVRSGDAGNGAGNPIELEENSALSNVLNGFLIEGPGHQLKKNESGNSGTGYTNGDCEYLVAAGNINATGNKSNGTTIAGANGSAFPTACIGTP